MVVAAVNVCFLYVDINRSLDTIMIMIMRNMIITTTILFTLEHEANNMNHTDS